MMVNVWSKIVCLVFFAKAAIRHQDLQGFLHLRRIWLGFDDSFNDYDWLVFTFQCLQGCLASNEVWTPLSGQVGSSEKLW